MKRNEFKLLLEDWKRNFIVENEENEIPVASNREIAKDYFDYFNPDESFDEPGLDEPGLEDPSYSSDSEEDIDGFSGMYPDDPTYTPGDFSSMGNNDLDGEDIDDLLPDTDDLMLPESNLMDKDDDYGF